MLFWAPVGLKLADSAVAALPGIRGEVHEFSRSGMP